MSDADHLELELTDATAADLDATIAEADAVLAAMVPPGQVGPCHLCGYVWTPRPWSTGPPKSCARCRSLLWDQPAREGHLPPTAWKRAAEIRAAHTKVARDSYRRKRFRVLAEQLGRETCLEILGLQPSSGSWGLPQPEPIAPEVTVQPVSVPRPPITLMPTTMPPPPPRMSEEDIADRAATLLATLDGR